MAGIVPVRIKTANKWNMQKSGRKRLKNCSGGFNDNSDTIFIIMLIVPLVSVFVKAFEQERICILLQLPIR